MRLDRSKLRTNMKTLITVIKVFVLFTWLVILKDTNSYYSVYILCALVGGFCFFDNYRRKRTLSKKKNIVITIASVIFSACVVLSNYSLFFPFTSKNILNIPLCALGGIVAGREILMYACNVFPLKVDCEKIAQSRKSPLKVFFIAFGIIAVIDIVYLFVCTYPGVMTPDSLSQVEQALTGNYSNHHPFYHTVFIKLIINIGMSLFNNINVAVVLYSICSVMFMAGAFAYAIVTLYQSGLPQKALVLIFAVFALMPYNVAYSVTMWKDVVFGCAALWLVVSLFRVFKNIGKHSIANYIVLFLSSVAFCVWRSNGLYAFLVSVLALFVILRKKHIKVSLIMTVAFVLSYILLGPVLTLANVSQTSYSERLSIPLQQVARVITAGCELTEEEEEKLSKIMDVDEIPALYKEYISDPVKAHVNITGDDYLKEHNLEYLQLWLKLGIKYPQYYMAAFVEQTKGYWNGGYDYYLYDVGVDENDLGIVSVDNKISNIASAGYFFALNTQEFIQPIKSIGLHVWVLGGLCVVTLVTRRKEEMSLTLPILFVIATLMIATPVFSSFRYAYAVFTTLPFIAGVSLYYIKSNKARVNETEQEKAENE